MTVPTVLIICYGNPARQDDGLGPAMAAMLEKTPRDGVSIDTDYQLHVEHADAIAAHDIAVFVDAAVAGDEPFSFTPITPQRQQSFSSHSVSPAALMAMANDLFNARCQGHLLAIRGYSFDMFVEAMTPQAEANLQEAIRFMQGWLDALAKEST